MIFNGDTILNYILQRYERPEDLTEEVISYCRKGSFERNRSPQIAKPPVILVEDRDTSPADIALNNQK